MRRRPSQRFFSRCLWLVAAAVSANLTAITPVAGAQTARKPSRPAPAVQVKTFDSPQLAADALITAAEAFDVRAFEEMFGPGGKDLVFSADPVQDRERAARFVAAAHDKKSVSADPKNRNRAFLIVGNEDWPFPVPIVRRSVKWSFDTSAGRRELLYRRIGGNELDAIQICRGYVEAQHEYALRPREGFEVNQYAQRIISTPGKQDGLAWQRADGTWDGPVGEAVARAIAQGYTKQGEPYHGYYFKILKGQGPAAPLGQMDFLVGGAMIGGFALLAAPAQYGVTGVKSFIVSHDGVVYEKDLGPTTLDRFTRMERFNPDRSWSPVSLE